jgi:hypothetical protein
MEATYEKEKGGNERLVPKDKAIQGVQKMGFHWGSERLLLKGEQMQTDLENGSHCLKRRREGDEHSVLENESIQKDVRYSQGSERVHPGSERDLQTERQVTLGSRKGSTPEA